MRKVPRGPDEQPGRLPFIHITHRDRPFPTSRLLDLLPPKSILIEAGPRGQILRVEDECGAPLFEGPEAFFGESLLEYFEERGAPEFAACFEEALRGGKAQLCRLQVRGGKHSRRLSARVEPFCRDGKQMVSVMLRDIQHETEREEALTRQRELFDQVEEATKTGSWEFDPRTGLVTGSARFRRMAGLAGTHLSVPIHYRELLHCLAPEYREAALERFRKAAETGEVSECDAEALTPEGRRTLHCRAVPIRDAGGKVTRIVGSIRDVTARRQREKESQEQRELLKQALKVAQIGVWEWNTETDELKWSEEMYRLLHMDAEKERICLRRFEEMVDAETWEKARRQNAEAIATGQAFERNVRLRLRDGSFRILRTRAVPVNDGQGRRILLRGVSQDITESTEAAERVRESEARLQRLSRQLLHLADEERRRIARNLHETVAQSLAAVKMILGKLNSTVPAEEGEASELILSAKELTAQGLEELRTISHLMHPPLLDLAGLAPVLRSYAEGFSKRSGIGVTVETPEGLDRLDQEMETAIFRIVQEALTNVHRHSQSRRAEVRLTLSGGVLGVEVRDFGRGMKPANRGNKCPDAMGVGLAGIRERVRELQGKFEVWSEPGKGVLLRAELPLRTRTHPAQSGASAGWQG